MKALGLSRGGARKRLSGERGQKLDDETATKLLKLNQPDEAKRYLERHLRGEPEPLPDIEKGPEPTQKTEEAPDPSQGEASNGIESSLSTRDLGQQFWAANEYIARTILHWSQEEWQSSDLAHLIEQVEQYLTRNPADGPTRTWYDRVTSLSNRLHTARRVREASESERFVFKYLDGLEVDLRRIESDDWKEVLAAAESFHRKLRTIELALLTKEAFQELKPLSQKLALNPALDESIKAKLTGLASRVQIRCQQALQETDLSPEQLGFFCKCRQGIEDCLKSLFEGVSPPKPSLLNFSSRLGRLGHRFAVNELSAEQYRREIAKLEDSWFEQITFARAWYSERLSSNWTKPFLEGADEWLQAPFLEGADEWLQARVAFVDQAEREGERILARTGFSSFSK
jgi:hypothetical protein